MQIADCRYGFLLVVQLHETEQTNETNAKRAKSTYSLVTYRIQYLASTMPTESILQYGSQSINFYGDMAVGIGGDKWPAADCFCKMLTDSTHSTYFKELLNGKSVVELGAGTGFAGILLAQAHPTSKVILTDLADHVPLIERNKLLNPSITNITGAELDWCNDTHRKRAKYDVILALEW